MFSCRLCKLELVQISSYIDHCRKHLHYKGTIPCTHCKTILNSAKSFRRHYSSAHKKEQTATIDEIQNTFHCSHCKKKFKSVEEFRTHVRTQEYPNHQVQTVNVRGFP
jgi:hypothetical protein